ncbi:MAG: flavodoxin family protein [Clostridium perfringens]|nr:flavodoxin family protein [Clostridium perfringens]
MKVLAFNGSVKEKGNTYDALNEVAEELRKENIDVEIIHVGNKNIRGCLACGGCSKNKNCKCVIDDEVNEWIKKMKEADGIILGSPVYYAALNGTMKSFLDRAFMVAGANGALFRHKVGTSIAVARRAGTVQTIEQLNNFISFTEMLMPSSNYWNVVYGGAPGEGKNDAEGMQTMRILGKNMAWLMKLVDYGKDAIKEPEIEVKIK